MSSATRVVRQVDTPEGYSVSIGKNEEYTRIEVATDTAVVFIDINDPTLLYAIAGFLHLEADRLRKERKE